MARDSWPQGVAWRLRFAGRPWQVAAKAVSCKEHLGDYGFLATHGCCVTRDFLPEIVYPCIPDPNREDEGGQTSSSLGVSTRLISAAELLQSNLATLAQRAGGE
ncbi:hypothetical protein GW17_00057264 [Ensete ventricosum]|nr:hypothetical protein GW17_00057264 [Ensete ventricosum]